MAVELNHTIVPASDKRRSADFLSHILGVKPGDPWGPFIPLAFANGVTLDCMDDAGFSEHHYAFLVDESQFDAIFERIQASGCGYYADPNRSQPYEINHRRGRRGVYFDDPDNHLMEIMTKHDG